MQVRSWLTSRWNSRGAVPILLLPLAFVYRGLAALDRWLYGLGIRRTRQFKTPVLVVGNITAGGTGKSPLVQRLVEALRDAGFAPGIAARGYGGTHQHSRGAALDVTPESDPGVTGDEAVAHARASGVPVCVCSVRALAIDDLVTRHGCDVVVCDDGLQHHGVNPALRIAVVDGVRGLGNGWFIPAGPLRESVARLDDVDFVFVNAAGAGPVPGLPKRIRPAAMRVDVIGFTRLDQPDVVIDAEDVLEAIDGADVTAVAGIGNPDRFFAALKQSGMQFQPRSFDDHHAFSHRDLERLGDGHMLTTTKDLVKIDHLLDASDVRRSRIWCAVAGAVVEQSVLDEIIARTRAHQDANGILQP